MGRELRFATSLILIGGFVLVIGVTMLLLESGAVTIWTPSLAVAGLVWTVIGILLLASHRRAHTKR